jgi:poly-gamma-glutamate capsule biosynthesis protein CapA/YwtB (metallophosphatase superfamily)
VWQRFKCTAAVRIKARAIGPVPCDFAFVLDVASDSSSDTRLLTRRSFLRLSVWAAAATAAPGHSVAAAERGVTLFLAGDVMTGRGIDQILPNPLPSAIAERGTKSARGYIELGERANGPIPPRTGFDYIWGDALAEIDARAPARRIVNLETSVTTHSGRWPKAINYRMHPRNVGCLRAAKIDCCALANNHVLDFALPGLQETLSTLGSAGIAAAGAGRNIAEAARPAVLELGGNKRLLVFSCGSPTSGIPPEWAATASQPGIQLVPELSRANARVLATRIASHARPGDLVIASIHWGKNWGYEIPVGQREFAHELIDSGAAHIVHGHSSHHPKGIEVYRDRLILYGCGDFMNDYEGITGHEEFRGALMLAYFPRVDPASGALVDLTMVPFQTVRFQLKRVKGRDSTWLQRRLTDASSGLGTRVELASDGALRLRW